MAEGTWYRGKLFTSACSRLADLVNGSRYYPLTNKLRKFGDDVPPGRPDEVFTVLYDHVLSRASKYLDKDVLEESLDDLPGYVEVPVEGADPVAQAWISVGRDMFDASERIKPDYYGTAR